MHRTFLVKDPHPQIRLQHGAFVLCRQCGEVLAPAHVSGGTARSPLCSCGVRSNFVSAVEHSQQQLAG